MSKFFSKISVIPATGLGVGFIPWAPGTFGSAFAVAVALVLPQSLFCTLGGALALLVFSLLTAGVCGLAEKQLGHDAGSIILDEVAGMWVALFLLPRVWWVWLGAFLLFRLFDIAKPLFIGKLQEIRGGWGVLLDDLAAGVLACVLMHGLVWGVSFLWLA